MKDEQLYEVIGRLYCRTLTQADAYSRLLEQANALASYNESLQQQLKPLNDERNDVEAERKDST